VNIKSVAFILRNFWGGYLVVVSTEGMSFTVPALNKPYLKEKEEPTWHSDAAWKCWIEEHYESM